jgi:hypothetical protein
MRTASADEENGHATLTVRDFVDIVQGEPNFHEPEPKQGASTGTFTVQCGTNESAHRNSDNFIVSPGQAHGAQHLHDYVGNVSTDAFSTNRKLAQARTTCLNGDQSTYFWPVLRTTDGEILRVDSALLQFRGSPAGKVTGMPRFLRTVTGDAKAATNGGANARAQWTCAGLSDRRTTKYPICPQGTALQRILDFPSCWDGHNTDSPNHRAHLVFPDSGGTCPLDTQAVPQLHIVLTYSGLDGVLPLLDGFPEQRHNPTTDHADFENVMDEALMARLVLCVNEGQECA